MKTYREIKPFDERKIEYRYPDGTIIKGEILDEVEVEHEERKNKIYKYLVQRILLGGKEE